MLYANYRFPEDIQMFRHKPSTEIESDEELVGRFITSVRETTVLHPRKSVLIVTHGGIY